MSFSNWAAVIAVLLIIFTVDLGRFAAADDQTHSNVKHDEEADNNKAISDLQHQNTADGHGVQLIRYCFITYLQFNSRKSERVGE